MRIPLTYANVASTLALSLALGSGVAVAAPKLTGKDIQNGTVSGKDVKNSSLTGKDVRDGTLRSKDFGAGQLPAARPDRRGRKVPPA